jgi:hypothetical protein
MTPSLLCEKGPLVSSHFCLAEFAYSLRSRFLITWRDAAPLPKTFGRVLEKKKACQLFVSGLGSGPATWADDAEVARDQELGVRAENRP